MSGAGHGGDSFLTVVVGLGGRWRSGVTCVNATPHTHARTHTNTHRRALTHTPRRTHWPAVTGARTHAHTRTYRQLGTDFCTSKRHRVYCTPLEKPTTLLLLLPPLLLLHTHTHAVLASTRLSRSFFFFKNLFIIYISFQFVGFYYYFYNNAVRSNIAVHVVVDLYRVNRIRIFEYYYFIRKINKLYIYRKNTYA